MDKQTLIQALKQWFADEHQNGNGPYIYDGDPDPCIGIDGVLDLGDLVDFIIKFAGGDRTDPLAGSSAVQFHNSQQE